MKIIIKKDGDGYLARVKGHQNLFAFAYSEKESIILSFTIGFVQNDKKFDYKSKRNNCVDIEFKCSGNIINDIGIITRYINRILVFA